MKEFIGTGLPYLETASLKGPFIVIEGGDGSGRSTQIVNLQARLEQRGTPSIVVGIKRSELVAGHLKKVMQTNLLCPRTLTLFYATDLADQLERTIVPALRAGFVVLADRYVYSLMARALVRKIDPDWLDAVFGFALKPDRVVFINTPPEVQAYRSFQKADTLDYWESGQDMQIAHDLYECYINYQTCLRSVFEELSVKFEFSEVNGDCHADDVHDQIVSALAPVLGKL
jgi:dTMP kinase